MRYLIFVFLALMVFVSMCVTPPEPADNFTNSSGNGTEIVETPTIYIQESTEISRDICAAKGLEGKVLVIHRTGCGACAIAVPILEELEAEFPDVEFEFLNTVVEEDGERMVEIGVIPYYVPTTVLDCHALIGAQSKETYQELLEAI